MENLPLDELLSNSTQYIKVWAEDWNSVKGKLQLFSRQSIYADWQADSEPFDVVLGKNGLAWGRGLHNIPASATIIKKEGDNKAPVGVFRISCAFGYSKQSPNPHWPYIYLHEKMLGVDDPASQYYNCLIDSSKIQHKDWNSAEIMLREDGLYQYGLVIDHNLNPAVPGAGSCIFMHTWRSENHGTEGCTAMPKENILKILQWLKAESNPLLVQIVGA
jgi:L,D-peptidoglycan transpeptidase YkuD (ErfK/YbiS/YcfS/YnhG family)